MEENNKPKRIGNLVERSNLFYSWNFPQNRELTIKRGEKNGKKRLCNEENTITN
jgi:hypothetical protein